MAAHGFYIGSRAQTGDELAASAVGAHHGVQAHEGTGLSGGLAVGRAVTVGILGGEGDDLMVQQCLQFLRMSGGVDAGVDDLVFPEKIVLAGLDLLDLGHHVAGGVDLFLGLQELCSGFCVFAVVKACPASGLPLHEDFVAVVDESSYLTGGGDDPVFTFLDILQDPDLHIW